jgi:hypothetical protein
MILQNAKTLTVKSAWALFLLLFEPKSLLVVGIKPCV